MSRISTGLVLVALLAAFAAPVHAATGSATLSWDPNTEPNISGYTVYWGTTSGTYAWSYWVGNATTYTVPNLTQGQAYYFAVQAKNTDGLVSPYSAEVSTTIPYTGPTGETQAAWMTRFGITDLMADNDGDGVINRDELINGTDPTIPNSWFLAEGATGYFKERLAIANPGTDTAHFTITFLRQPATPTDPAPAPIVQQYTLAGLNRMTINVNAIPGLENVSSSAQITTQLGGVVAERTLTWGGAAQMDAGHTGKAMTQTHATWYFAEGDARNFDTYLLLANPNAFAVNVNVAFLLDNGQTVQANYVVPGTQRQTVYTNNVAGIGHTSFSMTVTASAPIAAERAMYFSTATEWWKGGTDSAGVEAPSTQWFIAEGYVGAMFAEYILLSNPNPMTATTTIRYLRPAGPVITQTYTLAPSSRLTVFVNDVPGLLNTDVSAAISSDVPIVAERSMYWPGRWGQWYEGHNSVALTKLGTKWALAEGETGGAFNSVSYILMANPGATDATVNITVLRENQPPIVLQRTVPANARMTVNSGEIVQLASGERFGAIVESINGVPIAVERSLYWDGAGLKWGGGTNETGVIIK